jgi:hypothetical protein
MLEKIIEIAASKAIEVLSSVITAKIGVKDKRSKSAYKMLYEKSNTLKCINDHLEFVESWSRSIHILGMPRPRSLKDIYIHLSLTDDPRRLRLGEAFKDSLNYTIEDALRLGEHFIILGDPGSGKTTTQKKIANDLLQKRAFHESKQIPIVIRFQDIRPGGSLIQTLKQVLDIDFVRLNVGSDYADETTGAESEQERERKERERKEESDRFLLSERRALCTFLNEIKAFLLLDGFDELSPDTRLPILNEIEFLGPRLKESRIIITSRSADFIRKPESFLLFEIQHLSEEKMIRFVDLWFSSTLQRRKTADEFFIALGNTPYKDLASRPLTLANLCLVFEKYGSFPELPISIYRKTINLLLEEWDAERGIKRTSKYSLFDSHRKMDFLAAFAYHLVIGKSNTLAFSTDDLLVIYSRICERFGLPNEEGIATALEIESHTGIVIKSSYERYEFSHKSLQEFLVAEHIVKLRDIPSVGILLRDCPNELAIAVALSSDPSDWFCSLFHDKRKSIPLSPEWIVPFLSRIHLEQPTFQPMAELGATSLWLLSRCGELATSYALDGFLAMKTVSRSIQSYLDYCVITGSKLDNTLVSITYKELFPAKYQLPEEIVLPKFILDKHKSNLGV